jgi:hypothetical protein
MSQQIGAITVRRTFIAENSKRSIDWRKQSYDWNGLAIVTGKPSSVLVLWFYGTPMIWFWTLPCSVHNDCAIVDSNWGSMFEQASSLSVQVYDRVWAYAWPVFRGIRERESRVPAAVAIHHDYRFFQHFIWLSFFVHNFNIVNRDSKCNVWSCFDKTVHPPSNGRQQLLDCGHIRTAHRG